MRVFRSRSILYVYLLVWCLGISALGVSAQGIPETLTIPQNKTGALSAAAPTVLYTFQVLQPQSLTIQVLSLEPTMVPAFTVFDPSGLALQTQTGTSGIAQATLALTSAGNYTIQIQSASAGVGAFVISLTGSAVATVPVPLTLGQVTDGQVDAETPLAAYTLVGSPTDGLYVYVQPPAGSFFSPSVTIQDVATNQTIASSSSALGGVRYRLVPGSNTFQVLVGYGNHAPTEPFRICFGTASGPTACALDGAPVVAVVPTLISLAPTAIPTRFVPVSIPATAPCAVVSAQGATINVRSAPNTSSAIVTRLLPSSFAPVIGRLPDNSWYYVNISGVVGWISAAVVFPGGVCNTVPGVTPTPGPTAVVTSLPTLTPTVGPSATPTATATATATTGAPLQLNFGLPPTYGATTLTSGFTPDPFTIGITAGGPVDVTYLGGACVGSAAQAPDFSVTYTAGAFPTLRFFFVGPAGSDTSMIINAPSGSFFCNDDSFGTLNPTLDFSTPASGRYDVWIANVGSGGSGTLSVTENTGLNP